MNIAFISRATLYSSPGGDTKQIDLTAANLREMGVNVDIYLTTDTIDYYQYDLLHFFNIIRPADIIFHIRQSAKPYVISTIFLDFGSFEKETRGGVYRIINKLLSENAIEYLKAMLRAALNGEKIMSKEYIWWGHKKSIRYIAENAKILLPNSENEYRRLSLKFNIHKKYHVVPNGIDSAIAQKASEQKIKIKEYENAVLCVARIEGRKNQLNLIRALNNTNYQLIIHGKPSPNNMAYYTACRQEAAPNVQFTEWLSEEELYGMYHSVKVHVLASYFETTGLSSLEAAVMGCNVVITEKGDTKDYFDGNAWYCDPNDIASIKEAVDKAYTAPYNNTFREFILNNYTWTNAAKETLWAYNNI